MKDNQIIWNSKSENQKNYFIAVTMRNKNKEEIGFLPFSNRKNVSLTNRRGQEINYLNGNGFFKICDLIKDYAFFKDPGTRFEMQVVDFASEGANYEVFADNPWDAAVLVYCQLNKIDLSKICWI